MTKVSLVLSLLTIFFLMDRATMQNSDLYHEPYRPQYHYSPPCRWMNDPNGMVYADGEYHLFYQYNPDDVVWGPMHWGHAVSSDLVHWTTLPIALAPDALGPIWSGSVVVDARNTSGLVPGGGLVALYSYENQTQGAAYSSDKGRTWTMYAGNPILPALETDFRDPKVFWHEATQRWVMVIAAKKVIKIFTSTDLLHWEFASDFADHNFYGGVWEVPDLFPLMLNGQQKWVLIISINPGGPAGGSGTRYYIGRFDGHTFTDENPHQVTWLDYGQDNYAGTTWNDAPDGRRLFIGWMNNWVYASKIPTSVWRGAATMIHEFSLRETTEGVRMVQAPVPELKQLRTQIGRWSDLTIDGTRVLDGFSGQQLEIIAEFELGSAERFGFDLMMKDGESVRVLYHVPSSQLIVTRPASMLEGINPIAVAPLKADGHRVRMHIFVDLSSVEVFGNDGQVSLTSQVFPDPSADGAALFADKGSVTLSNLEVYALDSIWPTAAENATYEELCR